MRIKEWSAVIQLFLTAKHPQSNCIDPQSVRKHIFLTASAPRSQEFDHIRPATATAMMRIPADCPRMMTAVNSRMSARPHRTLVCMCFVVIYKRQCLFIVYSLISNLKSFSNSDCTLVISGPAIIHHLNAFAFKVNQKLWNHFQNCHVRHSREPFMIWLLAQLG